MATDQNLQFIREKISEVKSAIMYSLSNDVIKLPNQIIKAVKVDDEGQLWFVCSQPNSFIRECDSQFPARLKFFRKGVLYFIEVSGRATIVNKGNEPLIDKEGNPAIMIKMSMDSIEYMEPDQHDEVLFNNWMKKVSAWFQRMGSSIWTPAKPVFSKIHQ